MPHPPTWKRLVLNALRCLSSSAADVAAFFCSVLCLVEWCFSASHQHYFPLSFFSAFLSHDLEMLSESLSQASSATLGILIGLTFRSIFGTCVWLLSHIGFSHEARINNT